MATRNVNLIGAIQQSTTRNARATTSIIRIGWVVGKPAGGRVQVSIGGVATWCNYLDGSFPVDGQRVCVLVTASVWVVLGCVAETGLAGQTPSTIASTNVVMPTTATNQKMPLISQTIATPMAHVAGGNLVVDQAGVYSVTMATQFIVREAVTVLCACYAYIQGLPNGSWSTARSVGGWSTWVRSATTQPLPAGTSLYIDQATGGALAASTCVYTEIVLTQLSRA